jgi:hypothetical protein
MQQDDTISDFTLSFFFDFVSSLEMFYINSLHSFCDAWFEVQKQGALVSL